MNIAPAVRFWTKVKKTDLCWLWTCGVTDEGYGRFWYQGRNVRAHRFAYELLVGPIPKGLTIDHLCRNPSCVNPDHLEPVTSVENYRRGNGPGPTNSRKTHCKHGHPFSGDNLQWDIGPGRTPRRRCRTCRNENARIRAGSSKEGQ